MQTISKRKTGTIKIKMTISTVSASVSSSVALTTHVSNAVPTSSVS